MEIHFLGTGSAYPGMNRDNTSLCFSNHGYHVLVDVSGNPCRKLKQINIALEELDCIIFTHFHIDHIYGLPSLLWGMWLEHRKKPLLIFCDKRNEKNLNRWLDTMAVHEWGINFPIHIKTFNGDLSQELLVGGDMSISCFPALHSVPTIGLEIKLENQLIIYSGDTEVNAQIQTYQHIDVLIHEATSAIERNPNHTSLTEISEFYRVDSIGRVFLVHLSDHEPYDEEISRLQLADKIQKAEDLMCIKL
ncbi:MBL fold metallo-hydrolase [Fictibacillus phosphorivorans]|uniref:MBL fold metallo-hydrolase n=1 Tax=Fictibacillus phosphorivorans TaxID=1221500 RepID=UPI0012938D02|nr:ribonuclease Z [Fictibacillus phosphorivorans]MQR94096.1 ribonuclease Z [Fictibacillus phosphorivorans]